MVRASKENNNICGLTYENKNEKKKISAIEEAVRYAGRGMHTAREIEDHLNKRKYDFEEIRAAMRDMGAMGYLDDEGFCRSYIEKYYECGRGLIRIRQELVSKRKADPFMVDKVFEECDFPLSEHERAEELTEKLIKGEAVTDKLIAKVGRKLAYNGYDTDIVMAIVRTLSEKR